MASRSRTIRSGGRAWAWRKRVDEEAFDVVGAADDLLVAAVLVGADGGQFEAVERALAGQRLAPVALPLPGLARGVGLADDGGEQGVAAEVVVVVEVLVAQGQGVDPLGDSSSTVCSMRSGLRWSVKQAANWRMIAGESLGLAEQQGAAVGGDVAAVEVGEDFAGAEHGKVEVG